MDVRLFIGATTLALACAASAAAQSGRVKRAEPLPTPEARAERQETAARQGDSADDAETERDEAGNPVHRAGQVDKKVHVLSKPEPVYPSRARRHNVSGEVVLRLVLAASGKVEKVVVIKGLPNGVTEAAIKAARKIKFEPAERDGQKVSQWVTIHYNFNLY